MSSCRMTRTLPRVLASHVVAWVNTVISIEEFALLLFHVIVGRKSRVVVTTVETSIVEFRDIAWPLTAMLVSPELTWPRRHKPIGSVEASDLIRAAGSARHLGFDVGDRVCRCDEVLVHRRTRRSRRPSRTCAAPAPRRQPRTVRSKGARAARAWRRAKSARHELGFESLEARAKLSIDSVLLLVRHRSFSKAGLAEGAHAEGRGDASGRAAVHGRAQIHRVPRVEAAGVLLVAPEPELGPASFDPASFDPAPRTAPGSESLPPARRRRSMAELASESRPALPPPELPPQLIAQTVSATERARANQRGLNRTIRTFLPAPRNRFHSRPRRYSARSG